MNPQIHYVFRQGLAVCILLITCSVYFQATRMDSSSFKKENAAFILSGDAGNDRASEESTDRGFNSRLAIEEDDDDSAKDLYVIMIFENCGYIKPFVFNLHSYLPYNRDITTPPPKA